MSTPLETFLRIFFGKATQRESLSSGTMGIKEDMIMRAAAGKAKGMMEPLLEDKDDEDTSDDDDTNDDDDDNSHKITAGQRLKMLVVSCGITAGVAACVFTILFSGSIVIYVMAGLTFVTTPHSIYKEKRLMEAPSLTDMNNKLRENANQLQEEVDALAGEVDLLAPEADRASAVTEELQNIADEQGTNVEKLVALVKENQEILDMMKTNLKRRIVQDIIKLVLSTDKNNSGDFCKIEIKIVALKVRMQLQEYGVEFDEHKFYSLMNERPTVERAFEILKCLTAKEDDDNPNPNNEMFKINENATALFQ